MPESWERFGRGTEGWTERGDLACTARPRSDLLKMTHRDPKTKALYLTCCSCSVRKLTSCFRLPAPFIGTQAPPLPTSSLALGIRRTAATASRRTEDSSSPHLLPAPQALRVVPACKDPEALAFCLLALTAQRRGVGRCLVKKFEFLSTPRGCCRVPTRGD